MKTICVGISKFINDESGVTAIEYALIAALIAVVIIAGATSVGQAINTKFNNIALKVTG
jgi:pilus assembly protein Flp/PilA